MSRTDFGSLWTVFAWVALLLSGLSLLATLVLGLGKATGFGDYSWGAAFLPLLWFVVYYALEWLFGFWYDRRREQAEVEEAARDPRELHPR